MQLQIQREEESVAGLRVLVIDDVIDSKELVEMYLKLHDAKVMAVDRAKDAFRLLTSFQPELIISDIYMPEKDGYWLIEELNKINQQSRNRILTIALTVAAKKEDRQKLIEAGYDGYLAKPFFFEDLTALVVKLLGQKKLKSNYRSQ